MLSIRNSRQFITVAATISVRNKSSVRVRFAPSPTGYLHLGGLRTALYNYLFAKARDGAFILRIEDTDQSRKVDGATQQLQNDLNWVGIEIDEGPATKKGAYGPYIQSERLKLYKDQLKILLENCSAYHCFCTDKRLDLLRKEAMRTRTIPKYDNKCRHLKKEEVEKRLSREEKSCVRFKLKKDCETFEDMIYGNIAYDVALHEGDPVIMKSDGFPTYHFANVVDDHFMKISHVLRGVEWQISTTKHILMYRAFKWEPPTYAHLPLLINQDGTKLSKRQGDIKIGHYRENGIFPLALINYITSSGGGFTKDLIPGAKPMIFTIGELCDQFDISGVNNHSGKLMTETLVQFNRLELQRRIMCGGKILDNLIREVKDFVTRRFKDRVPLDELNLDDGHIRSILQWSVNRIYTISDLVDKDLSFLWMKPNIKKLEIILEGDELEKFYSMIEGHKKEFDRETINMIMKQFATDNNVEYGTLMKNLRTILSGLQEGPSVAEMMEILGKESTLTRVKACIDK